MKTIIVDTFFEADAMGHGGKRRTCQIAELIEQAGFTPTQFDRTILHSRASRIMAALKAVCNPKTYAFIAQYQLAIQKSWKAIAFCGFQRHLYTCKLKQHTGHPILIWEATKNYVVPYVAQALGFKVIAFPQNIEALVKNQDQFLESLAVELKALAAADIVFCISREEEWLLRLHGANAFYLPYYPPQPVLQQMLALREKRIHVEKQRFLILGNADNPPTLAGMIEQMKWLKRARETIAFQVDIAGFGTEKLAENCQHEDFTLHGAVSAEQLEALLANCRAALVHQAPTSGALTRIPELLIAGVPIIANRNACRSTDQYSGVFCYESWEELVACMNQPLEIPEMLPRPVSAEDQVKNLLVQFSDSPSGTIEICPVERN
ncbi:MAG: hypothetical protein MUC48_07110 [Leptolyngbya sp. Prado105]|jgi:glycosyltransferase involved in cell wall biosynthesis|nr:hypothetical protein [Leptolyngbya sp. Prado105]